MGLEKIQVETCKKVGILTMNNPPVNALTPEFRQEFKGRLIEMSKNDGIWALIITGVGEKFFAAGADIPGLLELDYESGLKRVQQTREFYSGLAFFEKPVIAAINGICLGAGLELALVCDIRIAAEHAKLGLPEVNLGLIPGAGGTQRLPRVIGSGWANYLLLTGEAISAKKALEIGLVQWVVPADSLIKEAIKIADRINSNGPLAVRGTKKVSSAGLQLSIEQGLDIENEAFANVCATQDKNEGITAFIEKRKPQFLGK
jgi:enoyl-CoA hydratase